MFKCDTTTGDEDEIRTEEHKLSSTNILLMVIEQQRALGQLFQHVQGGSVRSDVHIPPFHHFSSDSDSWTEYAVQLENYLEMHDVTADIRKNNFCCRAAEQSSSVLWVSCYRPSRVSKLHSKI